MPANGDDNWSSLYWQALENLDKLGAFVTQSLDGTKVTFNALNSNGARIPVITAELNETGGAKLSIGKLNDEIWIGGKKYTGDTGLRVTERTPDTHYVENDITAYMGLRFVCVHEHVSSTNFIDDASYWKPLSRSVEFVTQSGHGFNPLDVIISTSTGWARANSANPNNIPEPNILVLDSNTDSMLISGPGLIHYSGLGNGTYYLTTTGGLTLTFPEVGFSCPVLRSINNEWVSILDARPLEIV